jgi:hypothetical protein
MNTTAEYFKRFFVPKDLYEGRLLTPKHNRTQFLKENRQGEPIFDAMVCTDKEVIWHGDLEMHIDSDKLQDIAEQTNTQLYVVPFELAKSPVFFEGILKFAVWKSKPVKNY